MSSRWLNLDIFQIFMTFIKVCSRKVTWKYLYYFLTPLSIKAHLHSTTGRKGNYYRQTSTARLLMRAINCSTSLTTSLWFAAFALSFFADDFTDCSASFRSISVILSSSLLAWCSPLAGDSGELVTKINFVLVTGSSRNVDSENN